MRRTLRMLWVVIQWAALAVAAVSFVAGVHMWAVASAGQIERGYIDASQRLRAPLSGEEVCGYHVCVEHPRGSTCSSGRVADDLQVVVAAYSGPLRTRWFDGVRWKRYPTVEGTSEPGELLVPVQSERITNRCKDAVCTWQEHVMFCGVPEDIRVEHGLLHTYVRSRELPLTVMALTWILGTGFFVGLLIGQGRLKMLGRRVKRALSGNPSDD